MRRTAPVLLLALLASPILASTWLVPQNVPSIQQAIELADDGDTILVAPGGYRKSIDFLGKAIGLRAVNGPARTTIDGSASGSAVTFTRGEPRGALLEGFTITGGTGTWTAQSRWTGPYLLGGSLALGSNLFQIANLTVTGNHSGIYGAGIDTRSIATAVLRNCIVWGNTAPLGSQIAHNPRVGQEHVSLIHSDIEELQAGIFLGPGSATFWGPGNIDADPRFINADIGDYSLSRLSPCIDAGDGARRWTARDRAGYFRSRLFPRVRKRAAGAPAEPARCRARCGGSPE